MAAAFPSSTNVFVPGFNAGMTEKLITDFSRDWKKSPVTMLAGITTTDLPQGYFVRSDPSTQGLLLDDPQSMLWPDNTPFPIQEDVRRKHEFIKWDARRYTAATTVGYDELDFASWDIEAQVLNDLGNKAMLNRVKQFYSALNTSGNYTTIAGTTHTDTATNLGGGFWGAGTSANRYIQKSLAAINIQMEKSSVNGLGAVGERFLVIGPNVADGMARSQEIADGVFRTTDYSQYLQYDLWKNQWDTYGLPPILYGWVIVVDPWVKVTSKVGATDARSFASGTNVAYCLTKPGGIKSASGGKAFGSWEFFCPRGKEMVVETIDIPLNKQKLIRVNDYFDLKGVCTEASYLVTAVLS